MRIPLSLLLAAALVPTSGAQAALDGTPPTATITSSEGPRAPVVVTFSEPAGPVTAANFGVEHIDGSPVSGTRRCYDGAGTATACSGLVHKVRFSVADSFPVGDRVSIEINPEGVSPIQDAAANAAVNKVKTQLIRASASEIAAPITHRWNLVTHASASAGKFVAASTPGMRARFAFKGDSVTWLTRLSRKDGLAEMRVDGKLVRRFDLSSPDTRYQVRRTRTGFGAGSHVLEILALGQAGRRGNGTVVTVDGFKDERGWFSEVSANYLWASKSWRGAKGKVAVTGTSGAEIKVLFAGGSLDWWIPVGPAMGRSEILVDGTRVRIVDHYATSNGVARQSARGFKSGVHVLIMRATGKKSASSRGRAVGLDHIGTGASTSMFQGIGTWIDLYDYNSSTTATQIASMLDKMRGYGVKTVYLQTARYNSSRAILYPSRVDVWLAAAHARKMTVVGWYLPAYSEYMSKDVSRTIAIANYKSPSGERFDALGIDIEYRGASTQQEFNSDIVKHLNRVRNAVGVTYPISAIPPPPNQMEIAPEYWAGFPWKALGKGADAIHPMAYSSYRKGSQCPDQPRYCTELYTRNAVTQVRSVTENPTIPVHVIGGVADLLTRAEIRDFVSGAEKAKAYGASMYDHVTMMKDPRKYELLQEFKASPIT